MLYPYVIIDTSKKMIMLVLLEMVSNHLGNFQKRFKDSCSEMEITITYNEKKSRCSKVEIDPSKVT